MVIQLKERKRIFCQKFHRYSYYIFLILFNKKIKIWEIILKIYYISLSAIKLLIKPSIFHINRFLLLLVDPKINFIKIRLNFSLYVLKPCSFIS